MVRTTTTTATHTQIHTHWQTQSVVAGGAEATARNISTTTDRNAAGSRLTSSLACGCPSWGWWASVAPPHGMQQFMRLTWGRTTSAVNKHCTSPLVDAKHLVRLPPAAFRSACPDRGEWHMLAPSAPAGSAPQAVPRRSHTPPSPAPFTHMTYCIHRRTCLVCQLRKFSCNCHKLRTHSQSCPLLAPSAATTPAVVVVVVTWLVYGRVRRTLLGRRLWFLCGSHT